METPTVYEQIGGHAAIAAAVDEFYQRVLADPALAPFFTESDIGRLKAHQRAFLTFALGGPRAYNGRAMRAAHAGRRISDAAFDRVAGHLRATLEALGATAAVTAQVLATISPLREDVVGVPADADCAGAAGIRRCPMSARPGYAALQELAYS